jgi:hypothetical protein
VQLGNLEKGRRYNMILDNWLDGRLQTLADKDALRALDELEEEAREIEKLTGEGKYWEAYKRLFACISFFNTVAHQYPNIRSGIIRRLLDWIEKTKKAVDEIVKGVGGNGYTIGVSLPFGVSVAISFLVPVSDS